MRWLGPEKSEAGTSNDPDAGDHDKSSYMSILETSRFKRIRESSQIGNLEAEPNSVSDTMRNQATFQQGCGIAVRNEANFQHGFGICTMHSQAHFICSEFVQGCGIDSDVA